MNWPKAYWPTLVQKALKGKGKTTYLTLTTDQSLDYDTVKESVIKCYELTAEYYKNLFRNCKKEIGQNFFQFSHNVKLYFNKWIKAAKVNSLDELKELIVVEQFLRGIPLDVKVFLCEREIATLEKATSLAENYVLINAGKDKKSKFQNFNICKYFSLFTIMSLSVVFLVVFIL